jgi:hypothetical protein
MSPQGFSILFCFFIHPFILLTRMEFQILVANESHFSYAEAICELIGEAAKARGTGIAKRKPAYVEHKMKEGKAIIALQGEKLAGFCYIETWGHDKYVANSGLIVSPDFRRHGLAKRIKRKAFELSRKKYPEAKLFGITTSLPVMRINSELGYRPVPFSELTTDESFWQGCQSCPNYEILQSKQHQMCLCTGMLYEPKAEKKKKPKAKWSDKKGAEGTVAKRKPIKNKL